MKEFKLECLEAPEKAVLIKFPNSDGGIDYVYIPYPEFVYWIPKLYRKNITCTEWFKKHRKEPIFRWFNTLELMETHINKLYQHISKRDKILVHDINYYTDVYLYFKYEPY